jgi:glutamyl-tRNA reductase
VDRVDNVYLYNVDDLQGVVDTNVQGRQQEAEKAEEIVTQEVETYLQWERSLDAVPTIVDLREKIEDFRRKELDKTLCQLNGISDEQRRAVEILSQSIVNKMLHAPLVVLKQAAANPEGNDVIAIARKIFNLDRELEKPSHVHAKGFGAAEKNEPGNK